MRRSLNASVRPCCWRRIFPALAFGCAACGWAGALAGDGFPPEGGGGPPGGQVFHDFGITGVNVTPGEGGLYDVEVEVTIIPEAPPTQPIDVELRVGDGIPIAYLTAATAGLPAVDCCVSTCAVVPGFIFECSSVCPVGSSAPRVCSYKKKVKALGLTISAGESILAVADPFHLHREILGGEGVLPNSASAEVPPDASGDIYHDFGITGMKVTPAGQGLYHVEVEVTIIPEVPPTLPIELDLRLRGGLPVAREVVPTFGLPARSCCVSTCAVVPGFTFECSGVCPGGSSAPHVCSYTRAAKVRGVALAAGSELVAQLDPMAVHVETAGPEWPDMPSSFSVTVPPQGSGSASFVRGDSNGDGQLDISDAIVLLGCLFLGSACPGCRDAADSNDDSATDLADALYALGHIFLGSSAPPLPFPACGHDPTQDGLDCASYPPCED